MSGDLDDMEEKLKREVSLINRLQAENTKLKEALCEIAKLTGLESDRVERAIQILEEISVKLDFPLPFP